MSAERYRVTEYQHSGLDFLQIERGGSTHELCAQTDDSMIIGAIRQQSADIAELKVDVSGLRSSEAVFKFECDQLRTKLGEMVGRSKASRDDLHRALGRTDDTIIRLEHELSLSRLATERHKTHIDQCGEELKTTRADLAAAVSERDKLRSLKQAIDSAPVVAHIANKIGPDYFPCGLTILADSKLPPLGTELIAKPAKD